MSDAHLPSAVLFACTMNSVRSPLAAAIARQMFGHTVFVRSAGVMIGETDGFVAEVAREIGIDLSHHRSKLFDDLEDNYFDLIIALSPEAYDFALEWTRTSACAVEYWPTEDPSIVEGCRDAKIAVYRDLRDDLRRRIAARFGFAP